MAHSMEAVLGKVFAVYAGFWVLVLVVLFIAVGLLTKRRERVLRERQEAGPGGHH